MIISGYKRRQMPESKTTHFQLVLLHFQPGKVSWLSMGQQNRQL